MAWLWFLGKRRPSSLADQADYKEVHHAKEEPKKTPLPKGVEGKALGKGPNRKKQK